jgi:hypothetical protein
MTDSSCQCALIQTENAAASGTREFTACCASEGHIQKALQISGGPFMPHTLPVVAYPLCPLLLKPKSMQFQSPSR